ncbi:hypothetical protein TNCV_1198861 [Trichonephila clavipes]|uniref:Uncharacterized protein n=1 Tax=Trichonephila clavipes TaxID=2585209 RepID=A0A8X6S3G0_TRICX|nr:hypothetical protein TNCV_1198861 [Trichonephila clavipes]
MERAEDLISPVDKDHSQLGRIVTEKINGDFYDTLNPREYRQRGFHPNLQASRHSTKLALKGKSCYKCFSIPSALCI